MKKRVSHVTVALTAMLTFVTTALHAATINVSGGGANLQNAIVTAKAGDILKVGPGTYAPITSNNKKLTIESTDGAATTIIDGGNTQRCATLAVAATLEANPVQNATVLIGFTLQNGRHVTTEEMDGGGGAFGGTLNNCVLKNNTAFMGGGACVSWLNNCTINNNTAEGGGGTFCGVIYNSIYYGNSAADGGGGGAFDGVLYNCLLTGNTAAIGGGACFLTLNNCTLYGNICTTPAMAPFSFGGGVFQCYVNNSIIWGNTDDLGATDNCAFMSVGFLRNSCTTPLPSAAFDKGGNTASNPLFVNAPTDFRLQPGSPCIDKGRNFYTLGGKDTAIPSSATDLAGVPRIQNKTVDMGAYEYAPPVMVTVTFDANGGTPASEKVSQTLYEKYLIPSAPTRAGYRCTGWFTAKTGGTEVTSATTVSNAKAHTLYAQWAVHVNTYIITLNPQSGTVTPTSINVSENYAYPALPVPTRASYAFLGWFTASSGGDKITATTLVTSPGPHTLYAHWIASLFTVTFDANGGTLAGAPMWSGIQSYGEYYSRPSNPTRDEYTFLGWFNPATGAYITHNSIVNETTLFKAGWHHNGFGPVPAVTVHALADGPGTVTPGSVPVLNKKPVTLTAKPDKDALFIEWTDAVSGDVFTTPTLKVAPEKSTLYVARFRMKADCEAPVIYGVSKIHNTMVGVPFYTKVNINDAAKPVKFTATKLPPGLKINALGEITGVPTKAGDYPGATVKVTSVADGKKSATVTSPTITIEPLHPKAQGTFNGYFWDSANSCMNASFTATIAASGKITAKVTTAEGVFSFSAPSFSGKGGNTFHINAASKGQTLSLVLDSNAPWNDWQINGYFNDTYRGDAQRNPFLNKNDPAPTAALADLASFGKTYYTLALQPGGHVGGSLGDAGNIPEGHGYLTFTVSEKGAVKLAGKLADGTAVSGSATLLFWGGGDVSISCFIPLYSKQGFVSGWLDMNPAGKLGSTTWRWYYPGKTPTGKNIATEDRFSMQLEALGGRYGTVASLADHYAGKYFKTQLPDVGISVVEIEANKTAIKLPAAKAPVYDKNTNTFTRDPTGVGNPDLATLTVNAKTGLFSGKFNDYAESTDAKTGKRNLKTSSLSHAGVLIQRNGDYLGYGYYLFPDPSYADPANPKFKYNLRRSYPVTIE